MNLKTVIEACSPLALLGDPAVEITGITSDSRKIEKGFLFAAVKGELSDGHDFIDKAVNRGASAVIMEDPSHFGKALRARACGIVVENSRKAFGQAASRYYSNPSRGLKITGVTGTNGKTTTTYILESIFKAANLSVGVIGTINYRYGGTILPAPNTTPEPAELQKTLACMRDAGVTHCIMEVSSHALRQHRTEGCSFDTAVFTNLSQDHLDYHADMEDYGRAKEILFQDDPYKEKARVINIDDPYGRALSEKYSNVISFGLKGGDIRPLEIVEKEDGIDALLQSPAGEIRIAANLVGIYNLYNIMAAVGAAISLGIEREIIEEGIQGFRKVPGRLEPVALPEKYEGCRVFVDYAHTPDALERVIKAIKGTTKGNLLTLFGCGGNRDADKRSMMGAIAVKNSDFTIITSDNPRKEDPVLIIEEIERGAIDAGAERGKDYLVVADRRDAIREAAGIMKRGDTLLIAGKGHEDYQILGTERVYFDDRVEAERAFVFASEEIGKAVDHV